MKKYLTPVIFFLSGCIVGFGWAIGNPLIGALTILLALAIYMLEINDGKEEKDGSYQERIS